MRYVEKYFPPRIIKHRDRDPKRLWYLQPWRLLKIWLDKALNNLTCPQCWSCFEQEVGPPKALYNPNNAMNMYAYTPVIYLISECKIYFGL